MYLEVYLNQAYFPSGLPDLGGLTPDEVEPGFTRGAGEDVNDFLSEGVIEFFGLLLPPVFDFVIRRSPLVLRRGVGHPDCGIAGYGVRQSRLTSARLAPPMRLELHQ